MVNFPTHIPLCDSHIHAFLDLFISSVASICSTMVFPPFVNSNHVIVSVSIDFLSNSKRYAPFYCITHGYAHVDWDGLCDRLRDIQWEDIFNLIQDGGGGAKRPPTNIFLVASTNVGVSP